jgi:hypothetical protein
MENKKRSQYSWQMVLLCIFVSVSHPALAKAPSSSTEKHPTKKPTNAKLKPAASSAKESTVSPSPHLTAQQRQRELKRETVERKKPAIAAVREMPSRSFRRSTQPATKREARQKLSPSLAERTHSRYITILKETKQRTMVKTVVALPVTRTAGQDFKRSPKTRLSLQKPHRETHAKTNKSAAISVQPPQPPVMHESIVVAPVLPPPSSVTVSSPPTSPSPSPASPQLTIAPLPENPPQDAAITSTPLPPSVVSDVRLPTTTPSEPAAKSGTITFVEHKPGQRLTKEDNSSKERATYSAQKAPFAATVNEERLSYRINSVFVLPGDELFIEIFDGQKKAQYTIHSAFGSERILGQRRWRWFAPPTAGLYPVKIVHTRTRSAITLNVFVMVPREQIQDGYLNGYRIGHYPTEALRQMPMYNPPRGLIEVTPENEDTLVSPHFRLRQFLCKQEGNYPKYMILDARLLATLEQLLEMVNAHGYRARTFSIMSGYRTPHYNRAIGNRTTYSRHLWGDAADIFIDEEPRDGKMDDLNEDGVIDTHDADVIYQLIENASEPRLQKILLGGLARYRETSSHGPFIHVDARGSYARWGVRTLTRGGTTSAETAFQKDQSLPQPSFLDTQATPEPTP